MNNEQLKPDHGVPTSEDPDWDVETVIEQVWQDLQGEVNRSAILQVLLKIMPKYENARIATYVPLFVRRQTVAALRSQLDEAVRVKPIPAAGTLSTDAAPDGHLIEPNEPTTAVTLPASS